MNTKTYQQDLLDRLDTLGERLDTIGLHLIGCSIDGDKAAVDKWAEIGDEIAAEMKTLLLIHSALYEKK